MKLKDTTYDALKWIAMVLLPALGTLYFALAGIWNLPYSEQVVGTITALDTFLGLLLGISSSNYKGVGTFVIDADNEQYSIRMDPEDLPSLADKSTVTFNVEGVVNGKHVRMGNAMNTDSLAMFLIPIFMLATMLMAGIS